MRLIEKVWFEKHNAKWLLVPLLLPLSLLFSLLTFLRRSAFRLKVIKPSKIACPVIVVGNISVGGNGKTPVVIYLVELAIKMGFTPGVISRGYGGDLTHYDSTKSYPYLLENSSLSIEVGDEPLLIFKRCNIAVAVGSNRVASAQRLVNQGCDLIISDDGLQHYKLSRDVEVVVVDSKRLHGNGWLLPAGPLREGTWRLTQADFVIYNGSSTPLGESDLSMSLIATCVCNVLTGERVAIEKFILLNVTINAIAGIGSPQRFFTTLTSLNFIVSKRQNFVDHHRYQATDLSVFDDNIPLLMTEKDAVKCHDFAKAHWWYLPVNATFSSYDEQKIINKLQHLKTEN